MLKEEMENIGLGDEDTLLRVLGKFDPLIRHYARKLHYYDVSAYYDTPSKKNLLDTKAYTIRYSDDGFQFVSIVKE